MLFCLCRAIRYVLFRLAGAKVLIYYLKMCFYASYFLFLSNICNHFPYPAVELTNFAAQNDALCPERDANNP